MDSVPNSDDVDVIGKYQFPTVKLVNRALFCAVFGFCAELKKKLSTVEAENKTIREEFNVQRAKLKELFLQKEGNHILINDSYFFIIIHFDISIHEYENYKYEHSV